MSIKDIKKYRDLCLQGEKTLDERLNIFIQHREHILSEIEELKRHLTKIDKKINCYKTDICSVKVK
jgi:DNA-binding transcriptional MerR regulator